MRLLIILPLILLLALQVGAQEPCLGCTENQQCYPFGTALNIGNEQNYCDVSGSFLPQKQNGNFCSNNYECFSGFCSYGKCDDIYQKVKETSGVAERIFSVVQEKCFSDNDCKESQYCNTESTKCADVACPCGYVRSHKCIAYECCKDTDCGEGRKCNTGIYKCVDKGECSLLISNGDPSTKADILFIGDRYPDFETLKKSVDDIVDYNGNNGFNGLMSVEPFKSSKQKFNIWVMEAGNTIPYAYNPALGQNEPNHDAVKQLSAKCTSADYTILLSQASYRSFCYFGSPCFDSLFGKPSSQQGRLVLHEFGHGFGWLADEYVEPNLGNYPMSPNCAPNRETAISWWGNIPGTNYYGGCSYVDGNVRPTKNSIMRAQYILQDNYGSVNEKAILKKLEGYR